MLSLHRGNKQCSSSPLPFVTSKKPGVDIHLWVRECPSRTAGYSSSGRSKISPTRMTCRRNSQTVQHHIPYKRVSSGDVSQTWGADAGVLYPVASLLVWKVRDKQFKSRHRQFQASDSPSIPREQRRHPQFILSCHEMVSGHDLPSVFITVSEKSRLGYVS